MDQKTSNENNKRDFNCVQCNGKYSNMSNLKKHVKKYHPESKEYLASLNLRNKEFMFTCEHCNKHFTHLRNLKYHSKTHNTTQSIENQNTKRNQSCALCNNFNADPKTVIKHYKQTHSIPIEEKKFTFNTNEEFIAWKESFESQTNSKFVIKSSKSGKTGTIISLICHRSGNYIPEGKRLRVLKKQGSNKINALCPASIKVKKSEKMCEVTVIETHVGHENDMKYLSFTNLEREYLAEKIADNMSFDDILDEIRGSVFDSDLSRLHLVTRKDLHNIEASFHLNPSTKNSAKSKATSVESMVDDMLSKRDTALFYKPQGCQVKEWPALESDDFVLILMSPYQLKMLETYGSDCICIDRTYGLNNDFELITMLVVDDVLQGFPCAFLISNRCDKVVLEILYYFVKLQVGHVITPNVFMSDLVDSFYDVWLKEMSTPKIRLFSTWLVDRAWRKNLTKINSKKKQVSIYKNLKTLLEEQNLNEFSKNIKQFYKNLLNNSQTIAFSQYFKINFMDNMKCWASCYRSSVSMNINTNSNLERMHRTLKYTFLKGKNVRNLDTAINALMRLARDKCIDRKVILNKSKVSDSLEIIESSSDSNAEILQAAFEDNKKELLKILQELQQRVLSVTSQEELDLVKNSLNLEVLKF